MPEPWEERLRYVADRRDDIPPFTPNAQSLRADAIAAIDEIDRLRVELAETRSDLRDLHAEAHDDPCQRARCWVDAAHRDREVDGG
jgi:hypothetical protein